MRSSHGHCGTFGDSAGWETHTHTHTLFANRNLSELSTEHSSSTTLSLRVCVTSNLYVFGAILCILCHLKLDGWSRIIVTVLLCVCVCECECNHMGQKDRRICQTCRSNQSTKSLFLFARLPTSVSLSLWQWADLYYPCRGQSVWVCVYLCTSVCVCMLVWLFTCGRIWMSRWKWGNYRVLAFNTQDALMDRTVCQLVSVCLCVFQTQLEEETILLYLTHCLYYLPDWRMELQPCFWHEIHKC